MVLRAGVAEVTTAEAECRVWCFALQKKDGSQHLVIDARMANCHFSQPPRTALQSGAALARLRADSECGSYGSVVDFKNFLYHLTLPEGLHDLFHLPPVFSGPLRGQGLYRGTGRSV